jgi:uncharacterized membrane protein (UPF0182 family)
LALITVAIAAVFAMGFYTQWDTYLRFRYGGSFGLSDPIFGIDLGFYIFRLPFYELLQSSAAFLIELGHHRRGMPVRLLRAVPRHRPTIH